MDVPEPVSYYIYYRVRAEEQQRARDKVRVLQERLARTKSVQGRLLVKRGETDLWMEVYENVPDPRDFEDALAALVSKLELQAFLADGSQRHIERFQRPEPCA